MLKRFAKALVERTPYRIQRARALNRFSAIPETLAAMAKRGYDPRLVIDGGANVGEFSLLAARLFPKARVLMVEPQPACLELLRRLATKGRFELHAVGLGRDRGTLNLQIDPDAVTTGAHVVLPYDGQRQDNLVSVAVEPLDAILGDSISASDRALLKLDLQGWEMEALAGAEQSLGRIEVILTEVSFFKQAYEPEIEALVAYLHTRGFSLYDVAAISTRPRDDRAKQADFVFVRRDSPLMADTAWD